MAHYGQTVSAVVSYTSFSWASYLSKHSVYGVIASTTKKIQYTAT